MPENRIAFEVICGSAIVIMGLAEGSFMAFENSTLVPNLEKGLFRSDY
jgi:hypothetical protein